MPRILLLHASVGMGHQRAAYAIAQALQALPGTDVQVEDTLQHARAAFRRVYVSSFIRTVDIKPTLWTQFYDWTDHPPSLLSPVAAFRSLSTSLGVRGLPALLEQAQPDAIICTHFLPMEVLSSSRAGGPLLYGVLTDYHAHQFWACGDVDGYFVPTAQTREELTVAGVPRMRIHVTGIPIGPGIVYPVAPEARSALGLPAYKPVVLISGSGLSSKRIRAIVEHVMEQEVPATLVVVAGRNRMVTKALSNVLSTATTTLRVLGPQPSLDPWLAVSDLVVGKAGGLTVSEALAHGVPLLIKTPVPGQEQRNAEYVVRMGAGETHATADGIAHAITVLLRNYPRRTAMAAAAKQVGRPGAAQMIAAHVMADIERSRQRPVHAAATPRLSRALH